MLASLIRRIRRNHGLEHATIHVLSEKFKNFSAQGNSNHTGFSLNIYGDIPEEAVASAVREAHQRLQKGEHQLAVHPNCGTVLLTTATMATLAAQGSLAWEQRRHGRSPWSFNILVNALPGAILAVVGALIISRPLGIHLQARYTVDGRIGDLDIAAIRPVPATPITKLFQLLLTGGNFNLRAKSYRITTSGG